MGQAMQKLTGKVDEVQVQKQQEDEIRTIIEKYINDHYKEFVRVAKTWDGFYHMVYEIVEWGSEENDQRGLDLVLALMNPEEAFRSLSERSGAMQFKLPPVEKLKAEFTADSRAPQLTKDEFRQIIERVVTLNSFYVGQGARDVFLSIFGVPVLALIAKKVIPGPTQSISDDIFIPMATIGTVVCLAKTNRL